MQKGTDMKKRIFAVALTTLVMAVSLCSCSLADDTEERSGIETDTVNDYSYHDAEAEELDADYGYRDGEIAYNGISEDYSVSNKYSSGKYEEESRSEMMDQADDVEYTSGVNESTGTSVTKPNNGRKIIYSSNYEIETEAFSDSLDALDRLCEKYGAYYETSNTYGYKDNAKKAKYTIRVPVENYKAFIGEAGSLGTVTSSSQNNKDVTEQYFDTEARLESAKLREERILEILSEASKLDDVLRLERELSDIRYEIESYTGSLRKYDSLVSYATVSISINELIPEEEPEPEKKEKAPEPTFGERISESFNRGVSEFKAGFENLVVFLSYNIIVISIWIVILIVVIIVLNIVIRKIRRSYGKVGKDKKEDVKEKTESEDGIVKCETEVSADDDKENKKD